jgi:phosphotransferase system enzyme I (PtsI)
MSDSAGNKTEITYKGIAASPGVAHGPTFVYLQKELEIPLYVVEPEKRTHEIKRFENALTETRMQISKVRAEVAAKLGEDEAQIFDAHLLVLEDRALIEETISEHHESGYNIDYCFQTVARRFIEAFDHIDDEYIKERVMDIRDVAKRVLQNLLGVSAANLGQISGKRIIVSEDISPSDTASLQSGMVLGILTNVGSRTSHAVIMARSLQIPAVVGLHDITDKLENNDYVLVDGYDGIVVVNPSQETLFKYGRIEKERRDIEKVFYSSIKLPSVMRDGHAFSLKANIGGADDLPGVHHFGAEGVGLFRTEALFVRSDKFPSEEEQYEAYVEVVNGVKPHPTIIRTLDLGGDKRISSFYFSEEEANPFMGFRAIRFCLEHVDLFKDQLRAILRASAHGPVKVMYPMIGSLSELMQANVVLEESKTELRERGQAFDDKIQVGSMIEIPSAAYTADLLAAHCDFFSIGTNDLIQYMLAVDRVNDRIAHLYEPNHPAILRTIQHVIDAARKRKIPVSVCGEMAGDPIYAAMLFGMGANELSVAPASLPEIKFLLRHTSLKEARQLAKTVVALAEPTAIFEKLRLFYSDRVQKMLDLEKH